MFVLISAAFISEMMHLLHVAEIMTLNFRFIVFTIMVNRSKKTTIDEFQCLQGF